MRRNTEDAVARGVFGAPTIFAGGEMFWAGSPYGILRFGGRTCVEPPVPVDAGPGVFGACSDLDNLLLQPGG